MRILSVLLCSLAAVLAPQLSAGNHAATLAGGLTSVVNAARASAPCGRRVKGRGPAGRRVPQNAIEDQIREKQAQVARAQGSMKTAPAGRRRSSSSRRRRGSSSSHESFSSGAGDSSESCGGDGLLAFVHPVYAELPQRHPLKDASYVALTEAEKAEFIGLSNEIAQLKRQLLGLKKGSRPHLTLEMRICSMELERYSLTERLLGSSSELSEQIRVCSKRLWQLSDLEKEHAAHERTLMSGEEERHAAIELEIFKTRVDELKLKYGLA